MSNVRSGNSNAAEGAESSPIAKKLDLIEKPLLALVPEARPKRWQPVAGLLREQRQRTKVGQPTPAV